MDWYDEVLESLDYPTLRSMKLTGGMVVPFIHGTGQDHSIWVLPNGYFARHDRNALAMDLPGHGRSAGEPLKSVEAMVDWVIEVFEAG